MRRLNYQVDGERRDRREVVRDWIAKRASGG
jgi:glycine betaine/choline ABC-type transport system substrate-binding protein